MKRETYKGRKIKVVAGRGADFGYTRITLNGVDMGKWMQSEDEALRSTRSTIDHADTVDVSSGRYGAEWYAPGTYELCDEGHAKEIGGECGHHYCVAVHAESAPVVEEPAEVAPVEYRETALTVADVERVIRTEMGGKVRTAKQLEAAHTKSVKAALVEMRRANLGAYKLTLAALESAPWSPARDRDIEATKRIVRRAERGTLTSHGTYDVAAMRKPHPPVRYTETVPEYLVEVEPGHYATPEAAEQLSLI